MPWGNLPVTNGLPDACVRLFELATENRDVEARELQRRLLPVARLISSDYGVPGRAGYVGIRARF